MKASSVALLQLALDAYVMTFAEEDFWRGSPAQAAALKIADATGGVDAVRMRLAASKTKDMK